MVDCSGYLYFYEIFQMFFTMNLMAQRGHGHTNTVGARVSTSAVRVGAMAARGTYTRVNAAGNNDGHYSDATVEAGGAPAVGTNQFQVCM